jgi:hypothetical protein
MAVSLEKILVWHLLEKEIKPIKENKKENLNIVKYQLKGMKE